MASENTHFSSYALDRIFKGAKNIFFVGIGGISMSSLAEYCIRCGKRVFGYDAKRGRECERLEGRAHIRYCSTTDSVMGMDLVIFSNAIDKSCVPSSQRRYCSTVTPVRAAISSSCSATGSLVPQS